MSALDDAALEVRLREAALGADWPPTPDLRSAVTARIASSPIGIGASSSAGSGASSSRPAGLFDRAVPRRRAIRPAVRSILVLAVAAVLLLLLAGIAAALGFRLPGFEAERVASLPPASASPLSSSLGLGKAIPLADALALDRPRVLLPATSGAPDGVFELGAGDLRIVTLTFRAAPGAPTLAGADLALTLMAVPGSEEDPLVQKLLGPGTTIEPVTVGGVAGWWIAGAPHEILIRQPDGTVGVLHSALAGDTLVFARDGTLYRLESALGRDSTLAVAASMH